MKNTQIGRGKCSVNRKGQQNLPAPLPVSGKYGGTSTPMSTPWASLVSRRPGHDGDELVAKKTATAM